MRCPGHVLTEGNSLLNDEELEMIVILAREPHRNRKFMEFMRKHYPNVVKETFGKTIVDCRVVRRCERGAASHQGGAGGDADGTPMFYYAL